MGDKPAKTPLFSSHAGQGPFTIWQGMNFGTWLRFLAMRPPLHPSEAGRLALITALSMNNTVMSTLESLIFGRKIKNTQLNGSPVFILGHWRSGTTLLHNLMAEDKRLVTPNTYQVINPTHFLLTEEMTTKWTQWMLPEKRPMDNMTVTWESPQEDESALLNLTLSSAYLMLAFQGQREVYDRYFDMVGLPKAELENWKNAFVYFMKKLTAKTGKRILLKSPTHSYRIPILLELFPDAYFVNIVRNPYAVFNSTMHLRRKMFEANGLAPINTEGMEEDVSKTYMHLHECYTRDRALIRPERLFEIRYEELEVDPLAEMRNIYDYFHWDGFESIAPVIEKQLPSLREYKKNEFKMDPVLKRRVYDRFKPVFDTFNYPSGFETGAA